MNELKAVMAYHGESIHDLAEAIGMPYQNMRLRLNGDIPFKLEDVKKIAAHYCLSAEEIKKIFL